MTAPLSRDDAEQLYREALLLDRGDWEAWIGCYAEDCEFLVPAWKSELEATSDPDRELSLIYYKGRRNLEDRVWRARSGLSVASTPRPRVVHQVTKVLIEHAEGDAATVVSSFTVHRHDVRSGQSHALFGHYEHRLRRDDGAWRIARKKIVVLNDIIPAVVDAYAL